MSPLFFKMTVTMLSIVAVFLFIIIFKLEPSQDHRTNLIHASKIKKSAGLSLSTSAYYQSSDFYIGMIKDDYMSFAYAK